MSEDKEMAIHGHVIVSDTNRHKNRLVSSYMRSKKIYAFKHIYTDLITE